MKRPDRRTANDAEIAALREYCDILYTWACLPRRRSLCADLTALNSNNNLIKYTYEQTLLKYPSYITWIQRLLIQPDSNVITSMDFVLQPQHNVLNISNYRLLAAKSGYNRQWRKLHRH